MIQHVRSVSLWSKSYGVLRAASLIAEPNWWWTRTSIFVITWSHGLRRTTPGLTYKTWTLEGAISSVADPGVIQMHPRDPQIIPDLHNLALHMLGEVRSTLWGKILISSFYLPKERSELENSKYFDSQAFNKTAESSNIALQKQLRQL